MKVTIIGAGYVGLVTGVGLAKIGHNVTCVDVQAERVARINRGETPIHEPGLPELLAETLKAGRFNATTNLIKAIAGSDISLIAVGTPPRGEEIDLSFIATAAKQIAANLPHPHVVVVKSTVVPGTTENIVGKELPADCGLCMNPEFLREGCAVADFMNPDRIVIGERDAKSGDALMKLYAPFDCPKVRTTIRNAELIKYTSNALLATLVSFSNEIAQICEAIPGTNVEMVMDGLHLDRRLSPGGVKPGILSYLRAGPGFGGSCLPKDVNALRHFAPTPTPLLDAVMEVNNARPAQVIKLLGDVTGKTVTVLGLAFKPGTDDVRDSPALRLVEQLQTSGAKVRVYDPLAVAAGIDLHKDSATALRDADAVVVATAWPEFATWDWEKLARLMRRPLIVDGRNILRGVKLPATVIYRPIGVAP